jgi:large subunit ribosomal protein L32
VAVPKKRTSVSRKGLRRAGQHHKLYRKHPQTCPNCGDHMMPHHVCPSCGHYKGKQVVEIKQKAEAAEAAET